MGDVYSKQSIAGEVHSKELMHVFSVIQDHQEEVSMNRMNWSQFVKIGSVAQHNTLEGQMAIYVDCPVWGSFCAIIVYSVSSWFKKPL